MVDTSHTRAGRKVVSILELYMFRALKHFFFFVFLTVYQVSLHGCRNWALEKLQLSPTDRRFCVFSIVFSHDGREIFGGANNGYIYIYDRECNRQILRVCRIIS